MKAVHADAARTHTLASFTYDAGGNRLLKVAYATDGTTPTESTWYLRDGSGGVLSYTHVDELLQTTTEELPIAGVGSYLRASLKTLRSERPLGQYTSLLHHRWQRGCACN
ncbi:MAG: hypothetical protein IPG11_04605 [Flavobacteriales bacterium]|nr:hypothetical protein [Flavobacteriales bacterium]